MIATLEDMCKKIVFDNYNIQELIIPKFYKKELFSIKDIFNFDNNLFEEIIDENYKNKLFKVCKRKIKFELIGYYLNLKNDPSSNISFNDKKNILLILIDYYKSVGSTYKMNDLVVSLLKNNILIIDDIFIIGNIISKYPLENNLSYIKK